MSSGLRETEAFEEPGQADHGELAGRLRLVVTRLARRLRQEASAGISPSLTAALSSIERYAPMTPSELASVERVTRPTATRLIASLEDAGLIVREADERDRRSSTVRPSAEGRRLLARVRTRKNAYLARRLRQLDPAERAVLERAAAILERLLEDEAPR
jgi:DNA-binding MarR family transcriptional regulator